MSPRAMQFGRCVVAGLALCAAALPLAGCRGERSDAPPRQFFPDMDDQPRWNPQSSSEFFADGRTMRKPVEGTVPFGASSVLSEASWAKPMQDSRDRYLAASPEVYEGVDDLGDAVAEIPVSVSADMIRLGQTNFNIYCAVCHGYNGEGNDPADATKGSMVGRRWSGQIANLHDPKFQPGGEFGSAGHIFQIARHGKGEFPMQSMPGYKHALTPEETWGVVAYIRALQRSQAGTIEDVPAPERAGLGTPPPPQPVVEGGES